MAAMQSGGAIRIALIDSILERLTDSDEDQRVRKVLEAQRQEVEARIKRQSDDGDVVTSESAGAGDVIITLKPLSLSGEVGRS